MPDLALIINSDAGQMRPLEAAEVIEAARHGGRRSVETFDTREGFASAIEAALSSGADRVAIAGGDGTAASVLDLALETQSEMEIAPLPLGTANLLPRRLYSERDYRNVLEELDDYRRLTLPAGRVAQRSFFVALMAGAPVRFGQAREALRPDGGGRRFGIAAGRAAQGFGQLLTPHMRVCVDGAETRLAKRSAVISIPGGLRAMRGEADPLAGLEHRLVDEGDLAQLALQSASLLSLIPVGDGEHPVSAAPARLSGPKWIRLLLDGEYLKLRGPAEVRFIKNAGRFAAPRPI
jgi:diacylglycerol kinase family enzyme